VPVLDEGNPNLRNHTPFLGPNLVSKPSDFLIGCYEFTHEMFAPHPVLSSLQESKLFNGQVPRENRSDFDCYFFGNDLITKVAQRYGSEIPKISRQVLLQNQYQKSQFNGLHNLSTSPGVLYHAM
jgi:hypothetical protein